LRPFRLAWPTLTRRLTRMAFSQSRRARAARKRSRRVAAAVNDLTAVQWAVIQDAWGGCAYCGATASADAVLQRDCVLPISRGGRYTAQNVVPACRSCNASKCNEEVTHWLRRKRLDERVFLVRLYDINAMAALRIPASEVERAFDRFWRAPSSRDVAGHGLGMSLVNQIVVSQGGSVTIKSAQGRGTTVAITLPGDRA